MSIPVRGPFRVNAVPRSKIGKYWTLLLMALESIRDEHRMGKRGGGRF